MDPIGLDIPILPQPQQRPGQVPGVLCPRPNRSPECVEECQTSLLASEVVLLALHPIDVGGEHHEAALLLIPGG